MSRLSKHEVNLDILHHCPRLKTTFGSSAETLLTFAFARGVQDEELAQSLAPAISASKKSVLGKDLFLDSLIQDCFVCQTPQGRDSLRVDTTFFRSVLLADEQELLDAQERQTVFTELLENRVIQEQFFSSLDSLKKLRSILSLEGQALNAQSGLSRRVEILRTLEKTLLQLAELKSSESILQRIGCLADVMLSSTASERLRALLSFESGRVLLDTQLQLGVDGRLRHFQVTGITELSEPTIASGPLVRLYRQCIAWVRGYEYSEASLVSRLLDDIFHEQAPLVADLLGAIPSLEFYARGLFFREHVLARQLKVCLPQFSKEQAPRQLSGLFNPWLLKRTEAIIPIDINRMNCHETWVVTGPNSGGKTRLLQSLVVCQLLGQAGLFIPAERAELSWVRHLFLSLLESSSSDQSEGRLGTELLRVRKIFEACAPDSLIVLDELCSGTNPSEGESIFEMVLELLDELGAQAVISTHFLDLAARLAKEGKIGNLHFLQVELSEQQTPTYRFVPGVAESSLAGTTARRLGVTRDELLTVVQKRKQGS